MNKQMNLSIHELQAIIGGNGISIHFNGKPRVNKPIIGLPSPVKPKTAII